MRRLPPLASLRAFEAAARHLSFKRAAEELLVTPTAISHQVRLLEDTIGLRLFLRGTRQVTLTAEAQLLYPVLRDGFDAFARALGALRARPGRPAVTITATTAFTARWLLPRLAGFRELRPDIDLKLLASEETVDLEGGAADIAIRNLGGTERRHAVGAPLLIDRISPMASPRLGLRAPADLATATLLHFDWRRRDADTPTWARWLRAAGLTTIDGEAGLRFSDESHAIMAALAGHGVALLSETLTADERAAGTLVVPFGPALDGGALHLLTSGKRPAEPAVQAVRAWLHEQLRA